MEATDLHFQQFNNIKKQYPDAILLFRCDDHYEAYNEDAVQVAKRLNLPISEGTGEFKQITHFPYPELDNYLPKLVRAGYRIVICDKLTPPDKTKHLRPSSSIQPSKPSPPPPSAPPTPKPTSHLSHPRPSKPEKWIQATLF